MQRLSAEALGTAFWLIGVVASGIMRKAITSDNILAQFVSAITTGCIDNDSRPHFRRAFQPSRDAGFFGGGLRSNQVKPANSPSYKSQVSYSESGSQISSLTSTSSSYQAYPALARRNGAPKS
jgi:hypothetical protein